VYRIAQTEIVRLSLSLLDDREQLRDPSGYSAAFANIIQQNPNMVDTVYDFRNFT
jgi:hypothetical protein